MKYNEIIEKIEFANIQLDRLESEGLKGTTERNEREETLDKLETEKDETARALRMKAQREDEEENKTEEQQKEVQQANELLANLDFILQEWIVMKKEDILRIQNILQQCNEILNDQFLRSY